ncbi:hypothetical protein Sinme_1413 [Sinorhizobium meliloti AK83]|nr:hypothetical protein Sinme_1413 [Sinorhizobium meliloti AK83]SEI56290.1 hypothetical protein SAMN04244575_01061 [Sinorhizobium meliloti]
MSDLGLYEGCHVQLRNGETKGPLQREKNAHAKFPWSVGKHSWTPTGGYFLGEADPRDIVSVISTDSIVETPADQVTVAIREDVLAAAREAGLKARPAYDEFVSAIVESAFAAQSVTLAQPVVVDATTGQIGTLAPSLDEIVQTIAAAREEWLSDLCSDEDGLDRDFIGPAILRLIEGAQNESAPEIRPSEKTEGGQSDFCRFPECDCSMGTAERCGKPKHDPLFRTLDKLHPAARAFLQAIYPDAPLRAVEAPTDRWWRVSFGRPAHMVAHFDLEITRRGTGFDTWPKFPLWIEEDGTYRPGSHPAAVEALVAEESR